MSNPLFTIRLEPPATIMFWPLMNDVRSWLDSNKIEVAGFKSIQGSAGTGFEISFRSQVDADHFRLAFSP